MALLEQMESDALACRGLVTGGRTREALAGGGGRSRGGRRKAQRSDTARPRLSRRERRVVNDALFRSGAGAAPDALRESTELFNVRPRAPIAWALLREHSAGSATAPERCRTTVGSVDRRVRALIKRKGAFVRPVLANIEEPIRTAAADGTTLELDLPDPLHRLLAHAVAKFYGHHHHSESIGTTRIVRVIPPSNRPPLPPTRMRQLLA